MQSTDIPQHAKLLAALAKPTSAYKRQAWIATIGLLGFMASYLLLAGWFLLTAWRLTIGGGAGKDGFWGFVIAICAAFLGVFMLKGLFFMKRGSTEGMVEITAQQQPRLFDFLHKLADRAGAPRPHKVFVSARVNAAVFYDLSVVNLLFPSRKNLEIGLGLVNSLSLGELRAVLAHEFGHFAQRAMAVGRWVYVAQQIAAHLVARRDAFDKFLQGLSRFDIRIAWVGWILQVIVWSIRSVVDTAFGLLLIVERALSREMEMQADLVAVSLTGSDALIHALHKLQSADDSWDRALGFAFGEKADKRYVRDLFAVQTRIAGRMREILNDPSYGQVPELPVEHPAEHRVFKAELAQPPQMWLTHPLNHEREANAKRRYVRAPIDERSAWDLFMAPEVLREQLSAKVLETGQEQPQPIEDTLRAVDQQFEREYLHSRYRGVYLGRSVTRCAAYASDLADASMQTTPPLLEALYPESLVNDIEQLRSLGRELGQLRALQAGTLTPPEGVIRHRGRRVQLKQLPEVIAQVEAEVAALEQRLQAHDRQCRSLHQSLARQLGGGWAEYLQGLLAVLHYADHAEADLRDAEGVLGNTMRLATVTRRVTDKGRRRVVDAANELHRVLMLVFDQRNEMKLDAELLKRLGAASWYDALGACELPQARPENIGDWLDAIGGWVNHAAGACSALRRHALELLLLTEAQVAAWAREGVQPEAAPAPSKVPAKAPVLIAGKERKRETQLDWWSRFQSADGKLASTARFVVAGSIVAAVLGLGGTVGGADVTVYNGLARTVTVQLGNHRFDVGPHAAHTEVVDINHTYHVMARTARGELIEEFDAEVRDGSRFVYNVAAAAPLVEWTAIYGPATQRPDRMLGTPRWMASGADVLFAEPPQSVQTKRGVGATREVLSSLAEAGLGPQLSALKSDAERNKLIATHALWDPSESRDGPQWQMAASQLPDHAQLLARELAQRPDDVLLLRLEQDLAADDQKAAVCARHVAKARAAPDNANWQYVAARCLPDEAAKDRAFAEGFRRWPQHAWFAYAASYGQAGEAHWAAAIDAAERAARQQPAMANILGADIVRMHRMMGHRKSAAEVEFAKHSAELRFLLQSEGGSAPVADVLKPYPALMQGDLDGAMRLAQGDAETEARLVRLAAASDGADGALQARALAMSADRGLDRSTVFAAMALAVRQGRDPSAYLPAMKQAQPEHQQALLRFLEAVRAGRDLAGAERLLRGLPPELRGQGYSMAAIVLGPARTPPAWREAAKRLLFAAERPYFS